MSQGTGANPAICGWKERALLMDEELRVGMKLVLQSLAQIARELRMARERAEAQDEARASWQAQQRAALAGLQAR